MLLTTGCIKLDLSMTISKDDTVSGALIFAVSKELAEASKSQDESPTETGGLLADAPNVKPEPYDDGKYVGTQYAFEDVPLEAFKPKFNDDGSALTIVRDGHNIVVSGELDSSTSDSQTDSNPFGDAILKSFAASSSINISMTFPGEIKESSGKVDGQTITWVGEFGEKLSISAVVYAPLTPPIDWFLIGALAAVLITGAGVLTFVLSRRKRSGQGLGELSPDKSVVVLESPPDRLTLEEAMLIRPWYQQKRFVVPLVMAILTAFVYWVSFTS